VSCRLPCSGFDHLQLWVVKDFSRGLTARRLTASSRRAASAGPRCWRGAARGLEELDFSSAFSGTNLDTTKNATFRELRRSVGAHAISHTSQVTVMATGHRACAIASRVLGRALCKNLASKIGHF